jgi:GxxExxY protein
VYQACLAHELTLRQVPFSDQVRLPLDYKGLKLETTYRMDFLVDICLIVEIKSVDKMEPIFLAQTLTYLRLSNLWLGLLINFNVSVLKDGIKRVVYG